MSDILSLTDVYRRYPNQRRPAVDGVSLSVAEGEVLALVGESGSGKTTLLRLIAGLDAPDRGSICIDTVPVADQTHWVPPEKRRLGFVFQDGALFPHLDVFRNAAYGLAERNRARRARKVDYILTMVGLNGFQKRYPHQLSGGERQRLALARALAPQPRIVLLDEPFSSLDPALRRHLREEIQHILRKVNATAILVTHDTDDALVVGDRIAIFREGKIEQIGPPGDLYRHPRNAYCARLFGPANRVRLPGGEEIHVRPDQMRLHDTPRDDATPVRIRRIHDAGKHREAIVESVTEPGEVWTLILGTHQRFQPEQRAWVSIDPAAADGQ